MPTRTPHLLLRRSFGRPTGQQPNFTDYRARMRFTQKLHDWTDNLKANLIGPGRKTTVLSELSAKVPEELLPFVVLSDVGHANCTLFGHLEQVKALNAEKETADPIKAQAEIDRCMHVCMRACMRTCGRAGGRVGRRHHSQCVVRGVTTTDASHELQLRLRWGA